MDRSTTAIITSSSGLSTLRHMRPLRGLRLFGVAGIRDEEWELCDYDGNLTSHYHEEAGPDADSLMDSFVIGRARGMHCALLRERCAELWAGGTRICESKQTCFAIGFALGKKLKACRLPFLEDIIGYTFIFLIKDCLRIDFFFIRYIFRLSKSFLLTGVLSTSLHRFIDILGCPDRHTHSLQMKILLMLLIPQMRDQKATGTMPQGGDI
ncbi:hypothetical protein IRJ41_009236 [Triplophysa rosa]|uniref:Uncharacterized protein n=1 Tax=Triplophysa rosa TaxID=992332 RepID=A0A9W7TP00_TRIRA|nr:hypothetical protein IRJ41_009236 [Triplophysa rosa]